MTVIARTLAVVLVALGCLVSGGAGAAAQPAPNDAGAATSTAITVATVTSAGPLGQDSRESVITAAVVGLGLGGVIAFWQSRRHRRKRPPPEDPQDPPPQ